MTPVKPDSRPKVALSFDVEEWFHASVMEKYVPRASWHKQPSRLAEQVDNLLEFLEAIDAKATFFCLGILTERHTQVLRTIADAGHELGSHGMSHKNLYDLSHEDLRREIVDSKRALEDAIGVAIEGYRAANFSITDVAMDHMMEANYRYDSSVYAVEWHPNYGRLMKYPMRSDQPYSLVNGLWEVPLTVNKVLGFKMPWSGGAYLRHFPFGQFKSGFVRQAKKGYAQIYLHPWELDPYQPLPGSMSNLDRRRHSGGIDKVASRLESLNKSVAFCTIDKVLSSFRTS